MNADGTGLRQLTSGCGEVNRDPCWFPGNKIVFASNQDGNFEIHVIDSDGSNERRLTFNPADDFHPAWSP